MVANKKNGDNCKDASNRRDGAGLGKSERVANKKNSYNCRGGSDRKGDPRLSGSVANNNGGNAGGSLRHDVIVIGGGHAGIEAALAAARLGKKTLLACMSLASVGHMPCNPAIGGTGKGQLVREIDALGGQMGLAIDKAAIQTRMLNRSKGAAVHSPRAQADKAAYHEEMLRALRSEPNITLLEDEAMDICAERVAENVSRETITGIVSRETFSATPAVAATSAPATAPAATSAPAPAATPANRIAAVIFRKSGRKDCSAVIIAAGTYLRGVRLRGSERERGGPLGFKASDGLAKSLREHGIGLRRFKTGTPARAAKGSINCSDLQEQRGDAEGVKFSYMSKVPAKNLISCHITHTNESSHKIVRDNLKKSALYGGKTEGVGPRYCLCIEDKVVRFPERSSHQVFLEPEGIDAEEVYLQGLNINLPKREQKQFYRSILGLEKAEFLTYGYTIEYDCISPGELRLSLESKKIGGLFFAGQILGSSGYEEAGASGLVAGVNAARKLSGEEAIILDRAEAYIGVLIDDMVTKQPEEPYRIMTSRAEYRLSLRQDNADERLTPLGYIIGLAGEERYRKYIEAKEKIDNETERLKKAYLNEKEKKALGLKNPRKKISASDVLKMPGMSYEDLSPRIVFPAEALSAEERRKVETRIKYEGYIKKEEEAIARFRRQERRRIPVDLDYGKIRGLKKEAREKLEDLRPETLGQASRIPGVSPADMTVLMLRVR